MAELLLDSTAQALTDALESEKSSDDGDIEETQPEQDGSPESVDSEPEGTSEPLSAEQLAEKAGMTVSELYTRLQLNIDDETVSLESFKDKARDLKNVDFRASELDRERATFQAERLKQTEELNAWIGAIQSGKATVEDVTAIQQRSESLKAMADTRTRELIPEWRDGEIAKADKAAIGSMLTQFGLPSGSEEMISARG